MITLDFEDKYFCRVRFEIDESYLLCYDFMASKLRKFINMVKNNCMIRYYDILIELDKSCDILLSDLNNEADVSVRITKNKQNLRIVNSRIKKVTKAKNIINEYVTEYLNKMNETRYKIL